MRTVYVVPHTHWDREWYQPLELFRWRLVQMVDDLLDHMERQPEYACFNLDGQSIVVADYLEFRPENRERLETLIRAGRILIGPWWVQPDEFLPSGESHVRSLQRGIRYADRLGGSMRVGHCADQFGHIAQLPQIYAGLGLTSACLWRGVPDSVTGWSFHWRAPDGTILPVLYLRQSYSNGWRLPAVVDGLRERARTAERDRIEGEPALLMNGTDHSRFEKHVPGAIAAATDAEFDFRFATLAGYESAMLASGIDARVLEGELHSPDRSNVLPGTWSARMNIKQRDFQVGAWLERYAEPLELLARLRGGPDGLPALKHAWGLALENTPHDSICGCSVDQTHREMMPRYGRAEQLARQVAREAAVHIAGLTAGGALLVFRPVPHAPAVLEVDVPADWHAGPIALPGVGEVATALGPASEPETVYRDNVTPAGVLRHLDFLREGRYDIGWIERFDWSVNGGHLELTTTVGDGIASLDDRGTREAIAAAIDGAGLAGATATVVRRGSRAIRAVLPATPSIGVEAWSPAESTDRRTAGAMTARAREISNGRIDVALDSQGRLRIADTRTGLVVENASAFISEGDRGDEYTADILADAVASPRRVEVVACEADAVSATLSFASAYAVPAGLNRARTHRVRAGRSELTVRTVVTLWAGLDRVDFRVTVENSARDHRVRALFPLPFAVERVVTENQFHVAERPVCAAAWNGRSDELPTATFPQKTFAAMEHEAGERRLGIAVLNRGLPEGEMVRDADGRQAYALTLLRCVGWLSRNDLATRRGHAGPMLRTPDAQMQGAHTFEYALTMYEGRWSAAGIQAMAHAFAYPPVAWFSTAGTAGGATAVPLLECPDPRLVPSALHRSELDGAAVVRLYNASEVPVETSLRVPAASTTAHRADLLERGDEALRREGEGWHVAARPWEIVTIRFGHTS